MAEAIRGPAAAPLYLGIDGGGSRCTAVLATSSASSISELGRGHGGPANAGTVGMPAATASVDEAIEEAFAAAGLNRVSVAAACLGLAGAGRAAVREEWGAWAHRRGLASEVEVVPDGVPAFGGDGEPPWGVLVIAGTGSIVWGRRKEGSLERCGGRGGLVGDECSGYVVALAGLRAAVRMVDGWGPETRLFDRALIRFGVVTAADLLATLAQPGIARGRIAAFAEDVVAMAVAGDGVADRILADATADLSQQAASLARRLGFRAGEYPLRVAGGLLCHAALVRDGLVEKLTTAGLQPAAVIITADLAAAAVRTAARRSE